MKGLALLLTLIMFSYGFAQPKNYTTANAHSHNDYENAIPFYLAFQNGFGSIEADIFPVNGELLVAHGKQDLNQERSLKKLYLDPILHQFDSGQHRQLILLIDIKDDYKTSLALLSKELGPLKKYLTTSNKKKYITIAISGSRPSPGEYNNYPKYIFFDDDLKKTHSKEQWERVRLVSLPLYSVARWNGVDKLSATDSLQWKKRIDSVHAAGKRIRFWAAPDTELSWRTQMELDVDLIGTDKINELAEFIRNQKTRQ
jgi:hypothetical protein